MGAAHRYIHGPSTFRALPALPPRRLPARAERSEKIAGLFAEVLEARDGHYPAIAESDAAAACGHPTRILKSLGNRDRVPDCYQLQVKSDSAQHDVHV